MFKNAGTTLDWSLQRCFGRQFVDHRDDEAMRASKDYLSAYLSGEPTIKALSSHWPPMPPVQVSGLDIHLLLLLRNPLERARSVYNFERAQAEDGSAGIQKARKQSFAEYIRWRLGPTAGPVVKNFHTRYCSGDYFGTDMERLYELALGNLHKKAIVGLVHRYGESMVLFEYKLQSTYPAIDLSWRVQNVSQAQSAPLQQRINTIASELGDTFEILVEENQYDLRLLEYLEKRMDDELARVPDLQDRLASLQKRNNLLK